MTRSFVRLTLASLALCLAWPLAAQSLPTTNPGPHAAKINGAPGHFGQRIYPVRFVAIDGRNIQPRDVLWLEPGRYELRVLVEIPSGRSYLRHPAETLRWQRADAQTRHEAMTIELDVEAGKTYQVRSRYNRNDSDGIPFSTVLWRLEE